MKGACSDSLLLLSRRPLLARDAVIGNLWRERPVSALNDATGSDPSTNPLRGIGAAPEIARSTEP
jgi:hypothetical protein